MKDIKNILSCPLCHRKLIRIRKSYYCKNCHEYYQIRKNIADFIVSALTRESQDSLQQYEMIHQTNWQKIHDGSYEILAAFAKGNKTVDIACGDGFIEELAPNTVGVDFSLNALLKARNRGAKYLVRAAAENLPFKNNAFDLAICAGSLEHFSDPQQAIHEMARISKIQILTVHRLPKIIFAKQVFSLMTTFFQLRHQPIENPVSEKKIIQLLKEAGLKMVF